MSENAQSIPFAGIDAFRMRLCVRLQFPKEEYETLLTFRAR